MYSVNKRDNGKIPANIIFSAAVSVMSREEAKVLMTIKAKNSLTEEDLFENIEKAFELMNNENSIDNGNENEKINENKNGNENKNVERNFSDDPFQILEDRKEQMSINLNMKKKNDVGDIKCRALIYLYSSLLKQKENLKNSFNLISTFDTSDNEIQNENENLRIVNLSNSFQINSNENNNTQIQKKKNLNNRNTSGQNNFKIMNAMSKNNKSYLILSCKWLLQVTFLIFIQLIGFCKFILCHKFSFLPKFLFF